MFTKPTVFILGAGVSQPFGFPSGQGLIGKICCSTKGMQDEMKRLLYHAAPKDREKIDIFINSLGKTPSGSIDRWLESNKTFIDLGKCAIAYVIAAAEKQLATPPVNQDWFTWLWRHLQTDLVTSLKNNRVWFITFNYDRVLEYTLEHAIDSTYVVAAPEEKQAAMAELNSRIIHIHGALGGGLRGLSDFGNVETIGQTRSSGRQVVSNAEAVSEYAKGIRIISEDIEASGVLEKAHDILRHAERAVFLGFGYEKRNVDRLNVMTHLPNARMDRTLFNAIPFSAAPVMGSAMGTEPGERDTAFRLFGQLIKIDDEQCDAVKFCRQYITF